MNEANETTYLKGCKRKVQYTSKKQAIRMKDKKCVSCHRLVFTLYEGLCIQCKCDKVIPTIKVRKHGRNS